MQWEYELLKIVDGGNHNGQDYVDYCNLDKSLKHLNLWGANGWEIAGTSTNTAGVGYVYLKRPKATTN